MRLVCEILLVMSVCSVADARSTTTAQAVPNFFVTGKVTDGAGNPIAGAKVRAACGEGTLFETGSAITDAQGKYRLVFKPGMHVKRGEGWGVGAQAATITAGKEGFYEQNLSRQGDLAMTDLREDDPDLQRWAARAKGVVYKGKPYEIDYVLLPA